MATEAHSEGGGSLEFHPMNQFIVKPLFGGDVINWYTPTNVTLWLFLAVLAIIGLMVLTTSKRAIVPSRGQSIAELAYGFVYKMVEDVTGKDGIKYFPYIMTLFLFILCANFLGLIPMSFTTTSHIAVTAVMGFGVFIAVTILGFVKKRRVVPEPVLGIGGTFAAAPYLGDHRTDFLFRAACKPLDPSCR